MRKKNTYSRFVQAVSFWGEKGSNYQKGKMINLLHHCIEQDITSFQASDFQGNPVERTFGTALSESGLGRDEFQLIGKYRQNANPEKDILQTVDDLLISLRTDYLDLLLLEEPNSKHEFADLIKRLAFQGKVLEFGGLELSHEQLKDLTTELPLRANERKPASYTQTRQLLDADTNTSKDITHLVWLPQEETWDSNSLTHELCEKYDVEPSQLWMVWMLQHPAHMHPVINHATEEKIDSIVASKGFTLDPVDWQKLNLLLS